MPKRARPQDDEIYDETIARLHPLSAIEILNRFPERNEEENAEDNHEDDVPSGDDEEVESTGHNNEITHETVARLTQLPAIEILNRSTIIGDLIVRTQITLNEPWTDEEDDVELIENGDTMPYEGDVLSSTDGDASSPASQ